MDTQILLMQGIEKFQKKDYQGVIQDLERALQIDPENADFHSHCCVARYKLGDGKGAIADCQQAANLYLGQGTAKEYQYSLENAREAAQE